MSLANYLRGTHFCDIFDMKSLRRGTTVTRITIIGLGLIGGSLGLALKRANLANLDLVGYARKTQVASRALELGAVDKTEEDLASAVNKAEVVIIATPIMAIKEILAKIADSLPPDCIVTDTASTKAQVMSWAQDYLPSTVSFVGGHPMAGKDTFGIDAADAKLFDCCTYCLVPAQDAPPEAFHSLAELVTQIGARPLPIGALEHDNFVAGVSHLPLLLSAALVAATTENPRWPAMSKLAAGGYRDLTRLASGNPEMSRDICITNRENITRWIDDLVKELTEFRRLMNDGDKELEDAFIRARQARQRWLQDMDVSSPRE